MSHGWVSGCGSALRSASSSRRAVNTGRNFSTALTPAVRRDAWAARPGTTSRKVRAPAAAGTRSREVGSGITQASAVQPRRSVAKVPRPPSSSPITQASNRSPGSGTPTLRRARSTASAAARPPFMSQLPRPCSCPFRTAPENGSPLQVCRSPGGTTSTWAFSISEPACSARLPGSRATSPQACRRSTSAPGKSGSAVRSSSGSCQWSSSSPSGSSRATRSDWISASASLPDTLGSRTSSPSSPTMAGTASSTAASTSARSCSARRRPAVLVVPGEEDTRPMVPARRAGRNRRTKPWRGCRVGVDTIAGPLCHSLQRQPTG